MKINELIKGEQFYIKVSDSLYSKDYNGNDALLVYHSSNENTSTCFLNNERIIIPNNYEVLLINDRIS